MNEITCAICGHTFDPVQHRSCTVCPLQTGCQLACCPNCGYEVVDPKQSVLASAFAKLFWKFSREKQNLQRMNNEIENSPESVAQTGQRLIDLPAGSKARISGFAPNISIDRKTQLQAYGVIPGYSLSVRQQKPVTIIQIEHTELAFESELAACIYLEK